MHIYMFVALCSVLLEALCIVSNMAQSQKHIVSSPILAFNWCVTLGKLIKLSALAFPHLLKGKDKPHLPGLL